MVDKIDKAAATGLGDLPRTEWPRVSAAQSLERPIDRLTPGSKLHRTVKDYLLTRLQASERSMTNFYARWQMNEKRLQAYIDLPKYEKVLKAATEAGEPPKVVSVVIPYSQAAISTIVTYLVQVFLGRKPIFQVGTYKKETVEAARLLEMVLQYNADHTRLAKHLFQFFNDGETYGVAILRTAWKQETGMRTRWRKEQTFGFGNVVTGEAPVRVREQTTTYAGNDVISIDPFMFFPDPNVPMSEVNARGEFVFWRTFEGKHTLKRDEAQGTVKWVDHAGEMPHNTNDVSGQSARNLAIGAPSGNAGTRVGADMLSKGYMQVDQGSVEIIPAELGLGQATVPEKWLFTLVNKTQIVQAEPLLNDHGKHPVVVAEPYSMGYGFGQPGIADYLAPIQDTLSWLVNSHIDNVRSALNNLVIVDPSRIEMQDLKNPQPGGIIRLKASAIGTDVRSAIQQLPIVDVTKGHIQDFELFKRIGDVLSSTTDNLRGNLAAGGRKTATEVRTAGEAAGSRLAAHARLISSQAMVDLTEQMSLNIQQFLDEEFYLNIVGSEGQKQSVHAHDAGVVIRPEMLVGDFYFPTHDGTLPLDRVAMLDVWKEVLVTVVQDPELRQQFSVAKIFEHVAELGGAKNIEAFKLDVQPDAQVAAAAQAGNAAPVGGTTPGVVPNPGARAAGAL